MSGCFAETMSLIERATAREVCARFRPVGRRSGNCLDRSSHTASDPYRY
jgi:hypothetical protein